MVFITYVKFWAAVYSLLSAISKMRAHEKYAERAEKSSPKNRESSCQQGNYKFEFSTTLRRRRVIGSECCRSSVSRGMISYVEMPSARRLGAHNARWSLMKSWLVKKVSVRNGCRSSVTVTQRSVHKFPPPLRERTQDANLGLQPNGVVAKGAAQQKKPPWKIAGLGRGRNVTSRDLSGRQGNCTAPEDSHQIAELESRCDDDDCQHY